MTKLRKLAIEKQNKAQMKKEKGQKATKIHGMRKIGRSQRREGGREEIGGAEKEKGRWEVGRSILIRRNQEGGDSVIRCFWRGQRYTENCQKIAKKIAIIN